MISLCVSCVNIRLITSMFKCMCVCRLCVYICACVDEPAQHSLSVVWCADFGSHSFVDPYINRASNSRQSAKWQTEQRKKQWCVEAPNWGTFSCKLCPNGKIHLLHHYVLLRTVSFFFTHFSFFTAPLFNILHIVGAKAFSYFQHFQT